MSKFAKERQDNRMKDYKASFNADEFKKRREESIISVRRQKREENILKRRNINVEEIEENERNTIIQQVLFYGIIYYILFTLRILYTFLNYLNY